MVTGHSNSSGSPVTIPILLTNTLFRMLRNKCFDVKCPCANHSYEVDNLPNDIDLEEVKSNMRKTIDCIRLYSYESNYQVLYQNIIDSIDYNHSVEIMLEQIKFMGSYKLYKRIDKNLKKKIFERMFVREQFKLYEWRENLLSERIPHGSWKTDNPYTGAASSLQILENFDEMIALSTGRFSLNQPEIYFDAFCEDWEFQSSYWYQKGYTVDYLRESIFDAGIACYFDFKDMLHILYEDCMTQPLKLTQIALKKIVEVEASIDQLPKELKTMAKQRVRYYLLLANHYFPHNDLYVMLQALFSSCDDIQDLISDEGKEMLKDIREFYKK